MSGRLPEGLVTSTDSIEGEIERVDYVAVEDITKLWKVYSTNKNLLANDVGKRLENLFWRIWSNGRIRDNIRGSQVAMLFHSISEGDVIRTTPTQSPRSNRFLPISTIEENRHQQPFVAEDATPGSVLQRSGSKDDDLSDNQNTPADDRDTLSDVAEAPLRVQGKGKGKAVSRPPPILKGSRTGPSTQQPKTARILTPTWKPDIREQDSDDEISPTTSTSAHLEAKAVASTGSVEEQSDDKSQSPNVQSKAPVGRTPLPRPYNPEANPEAKASKKKSAFVASTVSTKRRPTIIRRKSSQSSSSNNASKIPSPRLPSQSIAASPPPLPKIPSPRSARSPLAHPSGIKISNFPPLPESPPGLSPSTNPRTVRPCRSASPTASKPFQDSSLSALSPPRGGVDTTEALPLQDWLVDRDFRAKFVDRSMTSVLSTNLGVSSSASSNQPFSSQGGDGGGFEGKGKGKTPGTDYRDSIVSLKPPGAESSAIEDDDEDELTAAVLPRTKSQLTLLVENERKRESERSGKQRRSNRGRNI